MEYRKHELAPGLEKTRPFQLLRRAIRDFHQKLEPEKKFDLPPVPMILESLADVLNWLTERPRRLNHIDCFAAIDRHAGLAGFSWAMTKAGMLFQKEEVVHIPLFWAVATQEEQTHE